MARQNDLAREMKRNIRGKRCCPTLHQSATSNAIGFESTRALETSKQENAVAKEKKKKTERHNHNNNGEKTMDDEKRRREKEKRRQKDEDE